MWALAMAAALALAFAVGGGALVDFMTTNDAVRAQARQFLGFAALTMLTAMPGFVYDGILIGVTLNAVMRNGMLVSLLLFLGAAVLLQPPLGNAGLWLALHIWFLARAGYYWWALERKRIGLFAA
jgi:Na+-driven multidrug efflux pump